MEPIAVILDRVLRDLGFELVHVATIVHSDHRYRMNDTSGERYAQGVNYRIPDKGEQA